MDQMEWEKLQMMLQQARQRQGEMGQGADTWFNRFGTGDPNQGLPGSPSGPAYRRR